MLNEILILALCILCFIGGGLFGKKPFLICGAILLVELVIFVILYVLTYRISYHVASYLLYFDIALVTVICLFVLKNNKAFGVVSLIPIVVIFILHYVFSPYYFHKEYNETQYIGLCSSWSGIGETIVYYYETNGFIMKTSCTFSENYGVIYDDIRISRIHCFTF